MGDMMPSRETLLRAAEMIEDAERTMYGPTDEDQERRDEMLAIAKEPKS
jgi:hypothetical protein